MLEIFEKLITLLTTNVALTAIVPANNIFTGAVDVTMEKQSELLYPSIVLSQISEIQRTVPQGARDTQIQIDIFSRNSQLELENIYEAIITALSYQSGDSGTAHIFWQRLGGAPDMFEQDRRIWHRPCTFLVWSIKL